MPRVVDTTTQIAKLQKQLALLQKKEAAARDAKKERSLAKIVQLAKDGGVTAGDIALAFRQGAGARKRESGAGKSEGAVGGSVKVAPKYRNPANPEQPWTGQGKSP